MSKRPKLVNTKKTSGSDLNHPRQQGHSDCMHVRVHASSIKGGGVLLFLFITYQSAPISRGRPEVLSVYLFVSPDIPCPGLSQTFFPLCLKYDFTKIYDKRDDFEAV